MTLETSIKASTTIQQFYDIFKHRVSVDIDPLWGTDSVQVDEYEGAVSTDLIASAIFDNFCEMDQFQEENALELANLIETKVFMPLKRKLIQLEREGCCKALIYKVRNYTRKSWTPQDYKITSGYACLKHSMPLMLLKKTI